eukprot:scaffold3499_cov247-Pinguiococcus_pyrenoidosus.AAC.13
MLRPTMYVDAGSRSTAGDCCTAAPSGFSTWRLQQGRFQRNHNLRHADGEVTQHEIVTQP